MAALLPPDHPLAKLDTVPDHIAVQRSVSCFCQKGRKAEVAELPRPAPGTSFPIIRLTTWGTTNAIMSMGRSGSRPSASLPGADIENDIPLPVANRPPSTFPHIQKYRHCDAPDRSRPHLWPVRKFLRVSSAVVTDHLCFPVLCCPGERFFRCPAEIYTANPRKK